MTNQKDKKYNVKDYSVIPIDENDLIFLSEVLPIDLKTISEFKNYILKDKKSNFYFPGYRVCTNGEKAVEGYEIKNFDGGYSYQKGKKGLWIAKIGEVATKKFSFNTIHIYLFDSSLNAMAYRELFQKDGLYISTGGMISMKQNINLLNLLYFLLYETYDNEHVKINLYFCFSNTYANENNILKVNRIIEKVGFSSVKCARDNPINKNWMIDLEQQKSIK